MVLMSPPVPKDVELCMTISRAHLDQQVFGGIKYILSVILDLGSSAMFFKL